MESKPEDGAPQKTPEEIIASLTAEIADLKPKAEASSQNFERLKKAEQDKKELTDKLAEKGESGTFDSDKLKKEIEERVGLRLSGYDPEHLAEIERYAKGAGISLSEAAKSPFIIKAVDGLRAEKKSTETTPAPSNRTVMFNGKPVSEVFKNGTPAEKQAAFEARMRGGTKSSE